MATHEEELKKAVEKLYPYRFEGFPYINARLDLLEHQVEISKISLQSALAKVEEMDKYLNTLGAENTDLKERIEKLEKLHPEE